MLRNTDYLAHLPRLKHLHEITLRIPPGQADLSLVAREERISDLAISYEPALDSLSPLSSLAGLKRLSILAAGIRDLGGISGCLALEEVILRKCASLNSLKGLEGKRLQVFEARECPRIADVSELGASSLVSLNLAATGVRDLDSLAGTPSLLALDITGTPIISLDFLAQAPSLRRLRAALTTIDVEKLERLNIAHGLDYLEISPTRGVSDLGFLPPGLTTLLLFPSEDLRSLAGIEQCRQLTSLTIVGAARLSDVGGLLSLENLGDLTLFDCPEIRNLTGIENLHNLSHLRLSKVPHLDQSVKLTQGCLLHIIDPGQSKPGAKGSVSPSRMDARP